MMRPERAPWSGESRSETRVYMGAGTRRRLEESGRAARRNESSRTIRILESGAIPIPIRNWNLNSNLNLMYQWRASRSSLEVTRRISEPRREDSPQRLASDVRAARDVARATANANNRAPQRQREKMDLGA